MATDAYYCCSSAGFYWISKQRVNLDLSKWGELSLHYWTDQGVSKMDAETVTERINFGKDGFEYVRWPCFEHAYYALNDSIIEPINFKPIL